MHQSVNHESIGQWISKAVGLVLVMIFLLTAQSVQASTIYDITNDYSTTNNPTAGSVWSYGWEQPSTSSPGGTLTLYNTYTGSQWIDNNHHSGDNCPTIWKNVGSSNSYGVAPGEVSIHPGWDNSFSVVRWTSPIAGQVSVSGYFGAGDIGSMSYYIATNGVVGTSWLTDPGTETYSFTQTVKVGDTIDFIVGVPIGGSYGYGNTPVEAKITSAVPIPAAAWLLGSGLVGLFGIRKKYTNNNLGAYGFK